MARAFQKHGGHAKAKQFKRARKVLRTLKTMAGRVMRDVERKMDDAAFEAHKLRRSPESGQSCSP